MCVTCGGFDHGRVAGLVRTATHKQKGAQRVRGDMITLAEPLTFVAVAGSTAHLFQVLLGHYSGNTDSRY
nr:hypothetical protein 12 [bacterium]